MFRPTLVILNIFSTKQVQDQVQLNIPMKLEAPTIILNVTTPVP
jgi:hypothetical protein